MQVRIRAVSLNGRDRGRLERPCPDVPGAARIPLSDGAGVVIGVGPGVSRFEVGDRVVGTFFAGTWLDGDRPEGVMPYRRGGPGEGMLSEVVVGSEEGFVRVPEHLSFEEAATLTTAGVAAWVGLFKYGDLQPGEFVLLEGTGGVSSFGLLFSVAAGARPIITSSSDEKLARARALGAFGIVNYRTNPEWHDEVMALTGGLGVQQCSRDRGERPRSPWRSRRWRLGLTSRSSVDSRASAETSPSACSSTVMPLPPASMSGSRQDFEDMNRFISEARDPSHRRPGVRDGGSARGLRLLRERRFHG